MAISFTSVTTGNIKSNTDAASYAGSSWTPNNGSMLVAGVGSMRASGVPATPTMSGNGQTWTQIATKQGTATSQTIWRITLFATYVASASAGATTVDFGGETQRQCACYFLQVDGSDAVNGVVQTFVQTPSTDNGLGTTGTITLSAASDSNNRPISIFQASNGPLTPRASWTEVDDVTGPDSFGFEMQYRSDAFETTGTATIGTSEIWNIMAAEIKILSSTFIKTVDGLSKSSVKTKNGLAIASVKTINGLA